MEIGLLTLGDVLPDPLTGAAAPTDAQLQSFLTENAAQLRRPEFRMVSVVLFSGSAAASAGAAGGVAGDHGLAAQRAGADARAFRQRTEITAFRDDKRVARIFALKHGRQRKPVGEHMVQLRGRTHRWIRGLFHQ